MQGQQYAKATGGLSGQPVRQRSTHVVSELKRLTDGKLPIIGVGGIDDADSAKEKLSAVPTLYKFILALFIKAQNW